MERLKIFSRLKKKYLNASASMLMLLFALEGCCSQFIGSTNGLGNSIYATNLGANDTQIGLIMLVANITAVITLLPIGYWSDHTKSPGKVPAIMLMIMSVSYLFYACVPLLAPSNPMLMYFIFLALTAGVMATFGAPWQAFFTSCTTPQQQNDIFAYRNRVMFFVGFATPLLFGPLLRNAAGQNEKLLILRIFYIICSGLALLQALLIIRIDKKFSVKRQIVSQRASAPLYRVIAEALKDRRFVSFLVFIIIFYMSWHADWSIWYISQTQYCGMNEAHLSYNNAFASMAQMFCIGLWSKLNRKRSVSYTFHFGIIGLFTGGGSMLLALLCPQQASPWVLIVFNTIANGMNACIGLCILQLLLANMPEGNRALLISFYTLLVMISNSFMPLAGVKLYEVLGNNRTAMCWTYIILMAWRAVMLLWHNRRHMGMNAVHIAKS